MYSKIQLKLFLLLLFLILFLSAGIFFISQSQEKQILTIRTDQERQLRIFIDEILSLKGKDLYAVAFDYTYWDEMVDFVKDPLSPGMVRWAQENITGALSTYNIQYALILNNNKKVIFETHDPGVAASSLPLSGNDFSLVFDGVNFGHFYYWDNDVFWEVRGATIHPSSDIARKTASQGYFFVARCWDDKFLTELSSLLNGKVVLSRDTSTMAAIETETAIQKKASGKMYFKIALKNFMGKSIAMLTVERPFMLAGYLRDFSQGYRSFYIGASVVFVIVFLIFGLLWISMPLSRISQALYREDQLVLAGLSKSRSEFGRISQLIIEFFKQKEKLLKEIIERRRAQRKLRDAQAQLLQSEKMVAVGQLSSGIAHEIRNPLANIVLAVDCLRQELSAPSDTMNRQMDIIQKSAARANKIVMELLNFAKERKLNLTKVSLNEMLTDTLRLAENYIKSKKIFIERHFYEDHDIIIMIDCILVEQALINLIFNAVDAIDNRGMIIVNTFLKENKDTQKHYVDIEISDTGRGIPPDIQKKIFDPFFSTKELGFGTGLGLSNAYLIFQRHGATVEVSSEIGKGAKFVVTFPCEVKLS